MTGRIFDIQRYSVHDGAGIRTIVFFKGCFLRCRWCCNPESQNYEMEDSFGRDVTVAEVMSALERDRAYYRRSGGGVTLSGGEVLRQPNFARAILKAAKESGIHTAIESTALADYREIEKILPWLDMFLLDVKHMDSVKHKAFTGVGNDIILRNAERIAASGKTDLIIRVPVILGFNATVDEIKDIAQFAGSLNGVSELHLLPYHRFGEGKYAALGRKYPMGDVPPPPDAEMAALKIAVEETADLNCRVGG
ncbi:MAG: glycyl-radical enzyme activating protein [Defluviitaleaceae bacterium]|nr:glycyl-radical enzyme activating protein [Defluviitaleaceae bacterium]